MSSACGKVNNLDGSSGQFKRALWLVIIINAGMFLLEMFFSVVAESQSLKADALDFFADTLTYSISLLVIGRSIKLRSTVALLKGISLLLIGSWVISSTIYQGFILAVPQAIIMGNIGFLALLANVASVLVLFKFRDGDANVTSVWLCSRNDAIGNLAVILAASGVWASTTAWPDLVVAFMMASLFFWSAIQIIKQAIKELNFS